MEKGLFAIAVTALVLNLAPAAEAHGHFWHEAGWGLGGYVAPVVPVLGGTVYGGYPSYGYGSSFYPGYSSAYVYPHDSYAAPVDYGYYNTYPSSIGYWGRSWY